MRNGLEIKVAEKYIPTVEEKDIYRARRDFLSISGDGVFATLQGEGVTAGLPAVFLRLQDCNLHCGKDGIGWRCDAWYTWDKSTPEFWKERQNNLPHEVAEEISSAWLEAFGSTEAEPRLVITGGEPLLQQDKVIELVHLLNDWKIEIETNGTIAPRTELQNYQINCSPKLSSSGNPVRSRYRPEVLRAISNLSNSWFKFVVSGPEDEGEIRTIVRECGISPEKILLMSEGVSRDALETRNILIESIASRIGGVAIRRNQIFWFGDRRRT